MANKSSPVLVGVITTGNGIQSIVTTNSGSVAILDKGSALFTFGNAASGELGDGTNINKTTPIEIAIQRAQKIVGGFDNFSLIDYNNTLYSWGNGNSNKLGNAFSTANKITPVTITTKLTKETSWKQISLFKAHFLGITTDGALFAWGFGTLGRLGDGTTVSKSSPVQIGTSSWTMVATGDRHSAAIRTDGALFTWGYNNWGQLGDNTVTDKSSPIQIGTSSWTSVAAGNSYTAAIRSDGTLFTWGGNPTSQLGDGTVVNKSSPVLVPTASYSSWKMLSAGQSFAAALRNSDSGLFTWGSAATGRLGTGGSAVSHRSSPAQVGISSWTMVSAGERHALAITTDGTLWAWGDNNGRLGDGTNTTRTVPVPIGNSSWTTVSAGTTHTAAIRTDGALFTWGLGTSGQLGDGTAVSKSSPVQIGTDSWTSVAGGLNHTSAIKVDKTLFTWGINSVGQLGDGTTVAKSSPVQVGIPATYTSWKAISGNLNHTLAIRGSDSSLWAWGVNTNGQLGNGTVISQSYPIKIGSSSWTMVSVEEASSYGIDTEGRLYAWGRNTNGLLGDGTAVSKSSPVQISTVSYPEFKQISSQNYNNLAISTTGALYAWGYNDIGQLGDGTNVSKSSPVKVGSSSWTTVSVGFSHSLGITVDGKLFVWGSGDAYLGLGTRTPQTLNSPVQVATTYSGDYYSWKMLSAAGDHTIAIRSSDSTLWAWGANFAGQLGDGTTINKSSPVQVSTSSWTMVDAGVSHSAAIRTDGALFTWGGNSVGHLGDGTTINKSSPVQIGSSSWTSVSAGNSHTAAIRLDGRLFTWGVNSTGQLGDNTTINKSSPVQIGTSSWTMVSASVGGDQYTAAIRLDGGLFTWGRGLTGRLGSGLTTSRSSPVQVGTSSWTMVATSAGHTLAIRVGGSLFAWGDNSFGQFGDGTTTNRSSPVQIGSSSWTMVAAGNFYTAAIRIDGQLFTWGQNNTGQLGNDSTVNRSNAAQISTDSWTSVSAGNSHTVAIRSDGALFTWGSNSTGQVGDGTVANRSSETIIDFGITALTYDSWLSVSAGTYQTAAIRTDGILFTWGNNYGGELGDGTTTARFSPVQIGTSSWTSVAAEYLYTAAIRTDGALFTWGYNNWGQLGDGTTINKSSPIQIGTSSWTSVSAGLSHTAAITIDKKLFLWGDSTWGQVGSFLAGDGLELNRSSPTQLASGFTTPAYSWKLIATGDQAIHIAAIRTDGALFTWGFNSSGQLGDNTNVNKLAPIKIGSDSWTTVSVGINHTAAIRTDGALFTWGAGGAGQLGDGTTVAKSSPVQIGTSSWTMVTTGNQGTLAVRTDGALFGWGVNSLGEIGDNTTTNKSSPVQVGTSSWIMVSSGTSQFTAAIRVGGGLFTWGRNNNGQLGSSTTVNRSSPVQVGTSSWTSVSAGASHTAAIRLDGGLFTWGSGTSGILGSGLTTSRSSPVQVGTSSWTSVSAGTEHTAAIRSDGALFVWGSGASLGDGTAVSKSSPVQIGTSSWTMVSVGNAQGAIRTDGTLFTWGSNGFGQLGLGINTGISDRSSPVAVTVYDSNSAIYSSWTAVSAARGGAFTTAIRTDGSLFTWGINTNGQLGDGTTIEKFSPVQIGSSSWTIVEAGAVHIIAIDLYKNLWSWGRGAEGQLGSNTITSRSSPVVVNVRNIESTVSESWNFVSARKLDINNIGQVAAIRSDGALFTWGYSSHLGNGISSSDSNNLAKSNPTLIQSVKGSSFSFVSVGDNNTLAISTAGSLYAWGSNPSGQLGDGTTIDKLIPVQIGSSSWTKVTAGFSSTAAIRTDGALFTWGRNTFGQLGDDTTIDKSSPVQIGTSSWTSVGIFMETSAGAAKLATTADGKLFTWGLNTSGQLGDGTTIDKSSPVQIGSSSWSIVDSGTSVQAALNSNGEALMRGRNASGQLGLTETDLTPSTYIFTNVYSPITFRNDSWTLISSSRSGTNDHSLGLTSTGELYAWGDNTLGQLGDGTTINRLFLRKIGNSSWTVVSTGTSYSMGITADGKLFTWGYNNVGQLGDGTTIDKSSPVQIGTTSSWSAVAAGQGGTATSSYAYDINGILYSWGDNTLGQLGDLSETPKSSPNFIGYVLDNPSTFTYDSWSFVSTGDGHTAAIRTDGTLFTWGLGASGQLGIVNPALINFSYPIKVGTPWPGEGNKSWTMVSTGASHTAAIRSDKTLWTWGLNASAQLGDNTITNKASPIQIYAKDYTSWNTVTTGLQSLAIKKIDSSLWAWGNNANGQLGIGTVENKSSPVQIGNGSWSAIATNTSYTLGVTAGGNLFAWGNNASGQLGDGTIIAKSSPSQIGSLSNWKSVYVGSVGHSLAIKTDGSLWAWGLGTSGQLGDGTNINKSSPVQVPSVVQSDYSWKAISAGNSHTAAIRSSDGALFTWGLGTSGQLGDNNTINKSSPVQIGSSSWTTVSAGQSHTAAIRTDGGLFTWGNGTSGQLGDGTAVSKSSPVQIGTSSWTSVDAKGFHTAAIRIDGVLFAWGNNAFGQLGDNTTASKSSPVQIGTSSWTTVSAGITHSAAIRTDGGLFTWGDNPSGQLGDGTTINKSSPIQIGSSSWTSVSAGGTHTVAIRTDGGLFTWGNGTSGQLGDGTAVSKSSPVQIGTSSWTSVYAGSLTTAAIRIDGGLFTWGSNSFGQLGDNTTVSKSSPVQIGTSSWTMVATGGRHSAAIRTDGALFTWGFGTSGQLGDGTAASKSVPIVIGPIYTYDSWTMAAAGQSHTAAITTNGALFAWGGNSIGQLGDGTIINKFNLSQIGSSSWNFVSTYTNSVLGITISGALFAWGQNNVGQLGDISTVNKSTLTKIGNSSWSFVSAGESHSAAIRIDGGLFTWGLGSSGQLGDGTTIDKSSPVQIGTSSWTSVETGPATTTAIDSDGYLYAWGAGTSGQLGDNTTTNKSSPVLILATSNTDSWTFVEAGLYKTYGITSDNGLHAWGSASYDEDLSIPYGDMVTRTPYRILNIKNLNIPNLLQNTYPGSWSSINTSKIIPDDTSVGSLFTIAKDKEGSLYGWGYLNVTGDANLLLHHFFNPDDYGTSLRVPDKLLFFTPISSFVDVMLGQSNMIAVGIDDSNKHYFFASGDNTYGQLGDGTTVSKSSPVVVTSISGGYSANVYSSTTSSYKQ